MDYKTFDAEYGRVLETARSMDPAMLAAEVERLRALAGAVQPLSDQEEANRNIASLDRILAMDPPPISEAMAAAVRVHRRARNAQGSRDERIAHLRAGIDEIGHIADNADPGEQGQILNLNESLAMLMESLEIGASTDSVGEADAGPNTGR